MLACYGRVLEFLKIKILGLTEIFVLLGEREGRFGKLI
jgi:hypothetical protein